jgi:hypothetical protein
MTTNTTARDTAIRTNKFGAKCARCRVFIPAGEGQLSGSRSAGWQTTHIGACPAPVAPVAPAAPKATPGYYVRADGAAVEVLASKRNPERTYGKVLTFPADGSRPSWEYVPGAVYTVADLIPMTAEDAARIGLAHGYCIRCCAPLGGEPGKVATLSSQVAALIGYGQTCAARRGWAFPTGVAAQRAFIASQR